MVTENTVTWEEHVGFEVANNIRVFDSGSGVVRGLGLLSIFAGCANGVAIASASGQTKGELI
jgi:hypothetical protein